MLTSKELCDAWAEHPYKLKLEPDRSFKLALRGGYYILRLEGYDGPMQLHVQEDFIAIQEELKRTCPVKLFDEHGTAYFSVTEENSIYLISDCIRYYLKDLLETRCMLASLSWKSMYEAEYVSLGIFDIPLILSIHKQLHSILYSVCDDRFPPEPFLQLMIMEGKIDELCKEIQEKR